MKRPFPYMVGLTFALAAAAAHAGALVHGYAMGTESGPGVAQTAELLPGNNAVAISVGQVNSTAVASADISKGQFRVNVVAGEGSLYFHSGASASLSDTLTILGSLPEPARGYVFMHVDGTMAPGIGQSINPSISSAMASVAVRDAFGVVTHQALFRGSDCVGTQRDISHSCEVGKVFSRSDSLPFTVDDLHRTVDITAQLEADVSNGASANFSHTGTLEIVLPPGLSFTSASGRFLTSPVPEPAPGVIFAAGAAVASLMLTSRAHRQV